MPVDHSLNRTTPHSDASPAVDLVDEKSGMPSLLCITMSLDLRVPETPIIVATACSLMHAMNNADNALNKDIQSETLGQDLAFLGRTRRPSGWGQILVAQARGVPFPFSYQRWLARSDRRPRFTLF